MIRSGRYQCPNCQAPLGWFALHSTFRGGVKRTRFNDFVTCVGCSARLVLRARSAGSGLLIWQIFLPALLGIIFLAGATLALSFVPPEQGLIPAAVVLILFLAVFGVIFSVLRSRMERLIFQVEAL